MVVPPKIDTNGVFHKISPPIYSAQMRPCSFSSFTRFCRVAFTTKFLRELHFFQHRQQRGHVALQLGGAVGVGIQRNMAAVFQAGGQQQLHVGDTIPPHIDGIAVELHNLMVLANALVTRS